MPSQYYAPELRTVMETEIVVCQLKDSQHVRVLADGHHRTVQYVSKQFIGRPTSALCPGTPECSGRGTCYYQTSPVQCDCNQGWTGNDCSIAVAQATCPGVPPCNNYGTCNNQTLACICSPGWTGNSCNISTSFFCGF